MTIIFVLLIFWSTGAPGDVTLVEAYPTRAECERHLTVHQHARCDELMVPRPSVSCTTYRTKSGECAPTWEETVPQ